MATSLPAPDFASSVTKTKHPLVAKFSIVVPTGTTVSVEFGLDTKYGRSTSAVPAPAGGGLVSILVAGMMPATLYHMRAVVKLRDGWTHYDQDRQFQTGVLPLGPLPTLTALTAPNQTPNRGVELINIIEPSRISVVSDLAGNIIWYYPDDADRSWKGFAFPIKPLPNGNLVASISNMYMPTRPGGPLEPPQSVLREVDLTGETVVVAGRKHELWLIALNEDLAHLPTSKGTIVNALYYSHDFVSLPNGHTILIVQQSQPPTIDGLAPTGIVGDALIDLDENFNPVWVWSAFDWLDINRAPYSFPPDWTHCNAVLATPDGNLLLSSRHQSWIMKLDYANGQGSGKILWNLGFQGDFTLQTNGAPDPDMSHWFFCQHFPWILATSGPNITQLAVMDNGNDRVNPNGTYPNPGKDSPGAFSRALVLAINEPARTASIAWQFFPNVFNWWGGSAVRLANGNIEVDLAQPDPVGQEPPVDTPSCVMELTNAATPQLIWKMQIAPGAAYRSYRIPSLYPGVQW